MDNIRQLKIILNRNDVLEYSTNGVITSKPKQIVSKRTNENMTQNTEEKTNDSVPPKRRCIEKDCVYLQFI